MTEKVVATEVAEQEFARFAEAMDLDIEPSRMDEDDRKSFEQTRSVLLRAMEGGRLVIDTKGQPVLTLSSGEAITFREPTGASLMSMDQKKAGQSTARMFVALAEMTGTSVPFFSSMPQRDLKICTRLAGMLFS